MVKLRQYDPRPSRADPDARAARKKLEKESPYISMTEAAIKGGALALFAAVTLFPWQKQYEKHERTHHPERFENPDDFKNKNRVQEGGGGIRDRSDGKNERARRDEDDDRRERRRRERRQSEGGEREREYRVFLDRDREYRALPVEAAPSSVGSEGRYSGSEDGEYGRRYVEASRKDREYRHRRDVDDYGRPRGGSVDYDYRRSSREDRRR